jgi:hypothetical protein
MTERRALLALPALLGAIAVACASQGDGPTRAEPDADTAPPADAGAVIDGAGTADAASDGTGDASARPDEGADVGARDGSVGAEVFTAADVPADAPGLRDATVTDVPAPQDVQPADVPATPPPRSGGYYASTRTTRGTVDANLTSYQYAPAFVFDGGLYHYFACVGVAGDWIQHKSASTLAGLATAPFRTVLSPSPGENHTCDPAVVRGADGRWYLHYSNTPGGMYTDAGVAVASRPEGPYTRISTDLLGHYSGLGAGQYGRGQTTVTLGPDGGWYMAFTNQIAPLEPNGIVILRSPDPSFARTRTEVARFDASEIGGWSTQLSYDPQSGRFVFIEPAGAVGFLVTSYDTTFHRVAQETLPLPPGAGVPGEGQAFLTDSNGRLLTTSPDANGSLVVVGATNGPARGGLPRWITGPNEWRTFRVDPLGVVDLVAALPGSVRVAGWSYDPNDRGWSIDTHIYVGLPGGASRVGTNDRATRVPRPDVNAAEGTTGAHGFDVTIPTALRGAVEVCTAAINVGSGTNTWLACRTVTVAN